MSGLRTPDVVGMRCKLPSINYDDYNWSNYTYFKIDDVWFPIRFFRVKSKIIYRPKNVKLTETKEVCKYVIEKKNYYALKGKSEKGVGYKKNNNNNKPTPLIKS